MNTYHVTSTKAWQLQNDHFLSQSPEIKATNVIIFQKQFMKKENP